MPTVQIGYGEYFDRVLILMNKVLYLNSPEQMIIALSQLTSLIQGFSPPEGGEAEEFQQALLDLRSANYNLWALELEVRQTHISDKEKLQLSEEIRSLNEQRARAKARIDRTFGTIPEVKYYGDK